MKFQTRVSTEDDIGKLVAELSIQSSRTFDLGILFITPRPNRQVASIIEAVRGLTPVKHFLACTVSGTVSTKEEIEGTSAVLMVADLPGVTIRPFYLDQKTMDGTVSAADWYSFFDVFPNEEPVFLAFPDPFQLDINTFMDAVNTHYTGRPIIGGLASGGTSPGGNTLVLNDQYADHGMVGFALSGNIRVDTVVSQGCRPVGESFIVTKADRNIIYELAGRPFLEVLQDIVEHLNEKDTALARQSLFIGIARDEYKHKLGRGDFLIRGLMGVDEKMGAGVIGDYISTGQTVQIHVRDKDTATEDLNALLSAHNRNNGRGAPQGALVCSCNGRGLRLFNQPHHDIRLIQDYIGPVEAAGFFCAGEIGPIGEKNFIHGFTNSMALFYPKTGDDPAGDGASGA